MLINKKKRRRSLALEMVLVTVVSLGFGILVFGAANHIGYDLLIRHMESEQYYERELERHQESLRQFIEERQVTKENFQELYLWAQKEPNVYVMFYKSVDTLLDPYLPPEQADYYDFELMDGTRIKVEMDCYVDMAYLYGIDIFSLSVGCISFILLLLVFIHQKIRYINRLEQELRILGGGNLEYPITIRGNDEITVLAEGISALKNGILDQQHMREEAEKANMELVTAMSHDLRTPLTSLIGYLELLAMHRYDNEEQLEKYLGHCRSKAFQLKKMSDRLFEYFLIYGKQEHKYQFQPVSCEELLEDFCNSQFFDWQEQGGALDCQIEPLSGSVRVDSEYLQRVLNNLLSNLKKYGDFDYPLVVEAKEEGGMLEIRLTNQIWEKKNKAESTQIGLKTCKKILEKHGGAFSWGRDGEKFTVEMNFPLTK